MQPVPTLQRYFTYVLIGLFVVPQVTLATNGGFMCSWFSWLLSPFGGCEETALVETYPLEMAETPTDPQEYPYPTALPAPTPTIIQYSTTTQPINQTIVEEYVTVTGTGVTEDRVRQLITEANLWVDISKSLSLRPTSNSTSTSRIDTDLVTREYLLKSLDRVYDAVGDSGGDTTVVDVSADIAASLLASPSLFGASLAGTTTIGDGLALGTTTLQDLLTVDGAIYLAETSPLTTTNRLYNFGGELYWNGSVVTSSSTGNWSASGGDVFRLSGNVGIGTSTPQYTLHIQGTMGVTGNLAVNGTNRITSGGRFQASAGSVFSPGYTSNSDINSGIYFPATSQVAFVTNQIEHLRITDSGRIGIGTTTPVEKLEVLGSILIANDHGIKSRLFNGTITNLIRMESYNDVVVGGGQNQIQFFTASAERMRIRGDGNVGIGTTSPSSKLTVVGDALFTGSTTLPLIDAGGQVCDVRAYGAVGDNSTINDVAIAAAIAACPEGGTVYFPMGQFRISTPIVLDRPVTLRGAYSPRWSYSSSPRSSIRADFGTFAGVAMIHVRDRTISGQVNHNNGGRIEYLMLDGGSAGADVDGIYFEGLVRDWKLTDVDISQTTGNGFEAAVGTGSSNPRGFTIRGLSIYSADGHGFRATALNDSYIEDLLAVGNALRGIYISSMGETKINNSRSVFNALEGLYIDGSSNNGGLMFTDFSTDRNDRHGVRISLTGTTTVTFNGLLTRRDGANLGGGVETPYAGVAVIGSPAEKVAPVFINGLSQLVGLDDSANPPLAPLVGVRVLNASYVKVDGQLWGVDDAYVDGGGNNYFLIADNAIIKTGTAGVTETAPPLYTSGWVRATTTARLAFDGQVNIGSSTSNRLLNIVAPSNAGARFLDTTNNVTFDMRAEDFQAFFGTFSNHQLRFQTNNLSRLTIDTNGRVGIGTTTPITNLSVVGDFIATGALRDSSGDAGTNGQVLLSTGSATNWVSTTTLGIGGSGATTFLGLTDTPSDFSINGAIPYESSDALAFSSNFTYDGIELRIANRLDIDPGTSVGTIMQAFGSDFIRMRNYSESIGIGLNVMNDVTTGFGNYGFGLGSLTALTTGNSNIAIGADVITVATSSSDNIGFGSSALRTVTTGFANIAIGSSALRNNKTGFDNIAIGVNALATTTGYQNFALGRDALTALTTGYNNVAIGDRAGTALTIGYQNVFIGRRTGENSLSGANNIVIGHDIDVPGGTSASNRLNIGNLIFGTGIDGVDSTLSSGNIGIGTTSPSAKLDVWGDLRVGTSSQWAFNVDSATGRVSIGASPSDDLTFIGTNGLYVDGAIYGGDGIATNQQLGFGDGTTLLNAITSDVSSHLDFLVNGAEQMRLLANGNVGIGTTSPATTLHVDAANIGSGILTSQANLVVTSNSNQAIDRGGSLGFGGAYTSAGEQRIFAGIAGKKENSTGANQAGYLALYSNSNGALAEGMRITSVGNIGIGTTSPLAKLDVWGSFRVGTGTSPALAVNVANSAVGIGTTTPTAKLAVYSTSAQDALSIRTNDGTVWGIDQFGGLNVSGGLRMKYITDGGLNTWGYSDLNDTYIASGDGGAQSNILLMPGSGGNLGIGTKSPNTFKLEVAGNVGPSADDTYNLGAAGRDWGCLYQSDGQTGTCASDARLKEDISTLTFDSTDASALEKLVALEMKSFAFKSAPDSQYHGLIAQEVLAVAPELVTERSDGFLAVKYGDIQWLIVEAVQQLWAMVTGNTERIEALEARIKALESELGASPVSSQPANATPEVDGGGGVNQFVPNSESEIEEDTASNTLNELPIERAPEVVEEVLMEGEEIDESLETTEDEDLPPSGVDETTELQLPNEDDSGFNDTPETEEEGTIPATLSNSNEADSNDSPETISSAETLTE